MWTLLPSEHWEFGLWDVIRSLGVLADRAAAKGPLAIPGIGECLTTRSARAAIVAVLRALDLGPNACVGVPLYCCPVVFKAIQAAGCEPRFIDIDPRTFCLSLRDASAKSGQIDALIAVHMFGNVCNMQGLRTIMASRPLIEDCAQSLGSRYQGRMTGTIGDVGIFSFRSGKYLSVGEGGAISAADPGLRSRIAAKLEAWPDPRFKEEFVHIVDTFVRTRLRTRPLWGAAGIRIWDLYNRRVDFADKSPIAQTGIFKTDLATIHERLGQLGSRIEAQRALADHFSRSLNLDRVSVCKEPPGTYYNRYLFPFVLPSAGARDQVAADLRSHQVGTSGPYRDVVEGAARDFGYRGDCPETERLLPRVLVLPGYHALDRRDRDRIVLFLNNALSRIAAEASSSNRRPSASS